MNMQSPKEEHAAPANRQIQNISGCGPITVLYGLYIFKDFIFLTDYICWCYHKISLLQSDFF